MNNTQAMSILRAAIFPAIVGVRIVRRSMETMILHNALRTHRSSIHNGFSPGVDIVGHEFSVGSSYPWISERNTWLLSARAMWFEAIKFLQLRMRKLSHEPLQLCDNRDKTPRGAAEVVAVDTVESCPHSYCCRG